MSNRCTFLLLPFLLINGLLQATATTDDKAIGLSGSITENEGAIQVKINGKWGYLCDVSGSYPETRKGDLVCKDLGYRIAGKPLILDARSILRNQTLGYWTTNISCNPDDVNLLNCSNTGWTYGSECSKDVGFYNIRCFGDVFLSTEIGKGIVFIYNESLHQYQTMCRGGFTDATARIICRQVGYQTGQTAASHGFLVPNKNITMADQHYRCHGNETSLSQCRRYGGGCAYGTTFAEVQCRVRLAFIDKVVPSLASDRSHGIVKVFDEKTAIKRLCYDGFDENVAKVVCREWGIDDEGRVLPYTAYKYTSLDEKSAILSKSFNCKGSEERLKDCNSHNISSCANQDGISAVACSKATNKSDEGKVRIDPESNRVDVYYHGMWGSICANDWNDNAAKVVCGNASYAKAYMMNSDPFDQRPMWIFGLNCTGDEINLKSCNNTIDDPNYTCNSYQVAGAYCDNDFTVLNYTLVNGGKNYGYVQLTMNGRTGYVINTKKEPNLATAACNGLGFDGGYIYDMPEVASSYYWDVSIKVIWGNVHQLQLESTTVHFAEGKQKYISVYCNGNLKLDGGSSYSDGYILKNKFGKNYAFCADGFTKREGDAVCRELGFPQAVHVPSKLALISSYAPIGFGYFRCPVGANTTRECTSSAWSRQAGVACRSGRASVNCEVPTDTVTKIQGSVLITTICVILPVVLRLTGGYPDL
ncbi:hypothetical protein SNE40_009316 [Patella caerulea]|uniref:SRCR domain-containing protein n=1 Tax=Patella caerulea TaxID=87958 RepID=A0AAN8JV38_PATCE